MIFKSSFLDERSSVGASTDNAEQCEDRSGSAGTSPDLSLPPASHASLEGPNRIPREAEILPFSSNSSNVHRSSFLPGSHIGIMDEPQQHLSDKHATPSEQIEAITSPNSNNYTDAPRVNMFPAIPKPAALDSREQHDDAIDIACE